MNAALSSFISAIKSNGIAKQYYYCQLMPPPFMTNSQKTLGLIPFYVMGVNLPEFSLETQTIKDTGLNRQVVTDKNYGVVTMTFFSDQAMTIKLFFDVWLTSVVYDKGGKFMYPDDYTSDTLTVQQLNSAKTDVYDVTLNRLYPRAVSDVQLSSDSGAPFSFSVQFVYESWDSAPTGSNTIAPTASQILSQTQATINQLNGNVANQISQIQNNSIISAAVPINNQ